MIMKKFILAFLAVICLQGNAMAKTKTVKLRIIETSDVHGCFFPYDYINRRPMKGSMARVSTYLKELRTLSRRAPHVFLFARKPV